METSMDTKLVRPLTWMEAFDTWRANEAHAQKWIDAYKNRGYDSWDEWRQTYVAPLRLHERQWEMHRIVNPRRLVRWFRGGPFRSWVEQFYLGRTAPSFAELVEEPGIRSHEGILRLVNDFPQRTTIMGVRTPTEGGKRSSVVITEGMHRCCAIAIAARRGRDIAGELFIAIGSELPGGLPVVGQTTKN